MAKMVLLGAKNPFFWPKINFLETSSKFFDAIMAGHKKDNFFVLTASHGGLLGNHKNQFWTIFGTKICIFLRQAHVSLIFGLRWTQPNVIITCPHHEVTLDNFGFLVGAHSTVWWAVTRPQMAEGSFWGPKMQLFWPEINFLETLSNIFDTIMAGHEKHNFFVLIPSQGGPRGGR